MSKLSIVNSTEKPILANGLFDGPYEDVIQYSTATVTIVADTDTQVNFRQSQRGTYPAIWDRQFTVLANSVQVFTVPLVLRYFHLKLENLDGVKDQTMLNCSTIYRSELTIDTSGVETLVSDVNVTNQPAFQFSDGLLGVLDPRLTFGPGGLITQVSGLALNGICLLTEVSGLTFNGGKLEVSGGSAEPDLRFNFSGGSLVTTISGGVNVTNQPAFTFSNGLLEVSGGGSDPRFNFSGGSLVTTISGGVSVTNQPAFRFSDGLLEVSGGVVDPRFNFSGGSLVTTISGGVSVTNQPAFTFSNGLLEVSGGGSDPRFNFNGPCLLTDTSGLGAIENMIGVLTDTSGTVSLWSNAIVAQNELSAAVHLGSAWSAGSLSVYGSSLCVSSHRLQVAMSPDNTTYYGSQYVYQLTTSGDFGFNLPGTGANYLKLKLLDASSTLTAYANYRA